jgi:SOS response regulatory protein OraA/RecX
MGEVSDDDMQAYKNCLHPAVRSAYFDEQQYAAEYVRRQIEKTKSVVQEALTWLPYVGSVFEENDVGSVAAASDIDRVYRASLVIRKIEADMGETLPEEIKVRVRQDVYNIWEF